MDQVTFSSLFILGAQTLVGFLAAAFGIALWAHTREPAWVLIVLATLIGYVDRILQLLDKLGVWSLDVWTFDEVSILRLIFAVASPALYAIGLFLALRNFLKP